MECVQVTTTLPGREAADRLADELVRARLAACAHVVGPVASTYRWAGGVERAEEWYCHFKTTRARLGALADAIRARHSYELPEIVAVSLDGSEDYLRWIAENVG